MTARRAPAVSLAPLTLPDHGTAVEMLVRAFFDYPAFAWVLQDEKTRAAKLRWLFHRWLRIRQWHDELLMFDNGLGIIVGVQPDGEANVSIWSQIKVGLLTMPFVFGTAAFRRFVALDADVKKRHAAEITTPHFVIDILGVDPSAQGQGVGTKLLQAYLKAADEQRLPTYLITHRERNVKFYQRAGFTVLRAAPLCDDGIIGWSMRRAPS